MIQNSTNPKQKGKSTFEGLEENNKQSGVEFELTSKIPFSD